MLTPSGRGVVCCSLTPSGRGVACCSLTPRRSPSAGQTGEERHISHMQYVSWPDHGVPEQAADFVQFVQRVRAARAGLVEPTVVHCSAGIGRTGVLILMETAMCLIEANQPVYPLELVRAMRRQRAMMIQTPVSLSWERDGTG